MKVQNTREMRRQQNVRQLRNLGLDLSANIISFGRQDSTTSGGDEEQNPLAEAVFNTTTAIQNGTKGEEKHSHTVVKA